MLEKPLVFTYLSGGEYLPVPSFARLKQQLEERAPEVRRIFPAIL